MSAPLHPPLPGPVSYLTGEFPRASDTFIQREIAGLEAAGFDIRPCSVRRTGAEHLTGPEQRDLQARTFHVLEAAKRPAALRAHLAAMRAGRWGRTLRLAWSVSARGLRGRLYGLIYFHEAIVLAAHLRAIGAVHLHNHIAKSSGTVAMLAGEASGIPHSFTLHGPDIFFAPEHWRLDAKIARAAFVACISRFARAQAMLWSDSAHWDRLHIVHCGVDPARYAGAAEGAGTRALFVGRLSAVKGVPVLFDALERTPGVTLTLIGDGPDRPALEAAARARNLPVTFLGYRSQAEVAEALAAHDMLVLPSFAEGVPVVLMEALAAGRAAIATNVGGVSELIVEGETGLLIPPGDAGALAAAMRRVAGDAALRNHLAQAGRRKVKAEFDAAAEALRLGAHFVACHAGLPRPVERSGVDQ
ncbi:glycosyltransferase [Wenxinia saemankumensis]|uniref:Glycosyltransferase involved in cell wall bisynthesis n=1 Tax=Wenxinia saemankumensis TaxID=1447782 RepID=A0A1M6FZ00_9RHOB|nr:glycosyltransferase [Wenxinia saemankumensis]SHJ02978.1 Glycosyltransferase involved in cell wall bisynthesis [Wenxinia saemankumensis]